MKDPDMADPEPTEAPIDEQEADAAESQYWESILQTPVGCEAIGHLRNIHDIGNFRRTSNTAWSTTQLCVNRLESLNMIRVPLNDFYGYRVLRTTENILFQVFTEADGQAIASLINLRQADFLFPAGAKGLHLLNLFLTSLHGPVPAAMQSVQQPIKPRSFLDWDNFSFGFVAEDELFESVVAIGPRGALIPYPVSVNAPAYQLLRGIGLGLARHNWSLRVLDLRTQRDMTPDEPDEDFPVVERELYPTFGLGLAPVPGLIVQTLHNFPLLRQPLGYLLRIVKSDMRAFFREADLGLTNPSLPPGPDNSPLKQSLSLTVVGLSSFIILMDLLNIYVYNLNYLYYPRTYLAHQGRQRFRFDELMRKHFSGIIEEQNVINQLPARAGRRQMPILMDNAPKSTLDMLSIKSLARYPQRYSPSFDYYDFLTLRKAREGIFITDLANYSEQGITRNASNIYDQLRRNRQPYYRTDGSQAMG